MALSRALKEVEREKDPKISGICADGPASNKPDGKATQPNTTKVDKPMKDKNSCGGKR